MGFILYAVYYFNGEYRIMARNPMQRPEHQRGWQNEDKAEILIQTIDLDFCRNFVQYCKKNDLDPHVVIKKYSAMLAFIEFWENILDLFGYLEVSWCENNTWPAKIDCEYHEEEID